jgi:predicted DsbA family dithiol-disulfide isomerase
MTVMPARIDIEFVSDVVCPWCVIGLRGLEQAIAAIGDGIDASIRLRAFELNPDMPREGEPLGEHVTRKYGASTEQSAANREAIRQMADSLGFAMQLGREDRIRNSFDAHRLLHWAKGEGRQIALKHALFEAYFSRAEDIADPAVLVAACEAAGLDPVRARAIVDSDGFASEVRAEERLNREEGITAVPATIINGRYLISGGQPPAAFEKALRRIAAEVATAV